MGTYIEGQFILKCFPFLPKSGSERAGLIELVHMRRYSLHVELGTSDKSADLRPDE